MNWKNLVAAALISFVLTVAVLFIAVAIASAQDISEANNLQLFSEMSRRGLDRFGCWTEREVTAVWEPGAGALWHELEVTGRGVLFDIDRTYHYVYADSLEMWWPAGCDTLTARVRGVNTAGPGPWSIPSRIVLN